ncbi:MAG TPA: 4Fe-4S binding protein [Anaerolineae bacterium]|nr:4Fe-4S binding protein [Anaerolineae bacterium]
MSAQWWVRLRRIVQYLFLALFLYLFIITVKDRGSPLPVELFYRLDPLAAISASLAGRTIPSKLIWALITLAATLVLGRVWCGWVCPLGTLLDLFRFRRARGNTIRVPPRWRQVKFFLLFVVLISALFANLTLLILDPITILTRTLATAVMPALNYAFTTIEFGLYGFGPLQAPLAWLEMALRGSILPTEQPFYQLNVLLAFLFIGIVSLNLFTHRFWCRYLCPLGALLGLLTKVSWLRRVVGPGCNQCRRCSRDCTMGTVEPERGFAGDPGECILCLACLGTCPQESVTFKGQLGLAEWRSYDPSRRQLLASLATSVGGLVLLRTSPIARREHPRAIRPPGARENNLLAKCIRCGECMKVCPTSGLQPSFSESGLEGLWTPVLISRLGYCDYSCHACGQVCPSGAIPPLTLEEKRRTLIGLAYIDQNRCIPWADNVDCIVCEEMCPVPAKAVKLDEVEVLNDQGELVIVKRPRVVRDLCIGCGICEYKCPLNGEAAIRVYVPNELEYGESA